MELLNRARLARMNNFRPPAPKLKESAKDYGLVRYFDRWVSSMNLFHTHSFGGNFII